MDAARAVHYTVYNWAWALGLVRAVFAGWTLVDRPLQDTVLGVQNSDSLDS